jgi:hypothetical protein
VPGSGSSRPPPPARGGHGCCRSPLSARGTAGVLRGYKAQKPIRSRGRAKPVKSPISATSVVAASRSTPRRLISASTTGRMRQCSSCLRIVHGNCGTRQRRSFARAGRMTRRPGSVCALESNWSDPRSDAHRAERPFLESISFVAFRRCRTAAPWIAGWASIRPRKRCASRRFVGARSLSSRASRPNRGRAMLGAASGLPPKPVAQCRPTRPVSERCPPAAR